MQQLPRRRVFDLEKEDKMPNKIVYNAFNNDEVKAKKLSEKLSQTSHKTNAQTQRIDKRRWDDVAIDEGRIKS